MEKEKEKLARERKELSHAENTFEIYHLQKKPIYILLPSFQRAADPATTGGKKTAKKEATKKSEKAVTFDASTMADVDALQGPEPPRFAGDHGRSLAQTRGRLLAGPRVRWSQLVRQTI